MRRQHLAWEEEQWEDRKDEFPEEWRRQAFTVDWQGSLSADQLGEISDGFGEVLRRVGGAGSEPGAVRVHIQVSAVPIGEPPATAKS